MPETTDPAAGEDAELGSDEPPPEPVPVPPPATPPPPPPPDVTWSLRTALARAQVRQQQADAATIRTLERAEAAQARVATLRLQLGALEAADAQAVRRLDAARARLRSRAVGAYTGNDLSSLNLVLSSGDVNAVIRRAGMVESVLRRSRQVVESYRAARRAAGAAITRLFDDVAAAEADASSASVAVDDARRSAQDAAMQANALAAGSMIAISGFVFPVAAPSRFGNDFGAPRMVGTPDEHAHQGTDIFAAQDTPVVASERGVVTKVGTDRLGGIKLWLVGQSGTRYYFAHLSGYAPGVRDGLVVDAGALLGFVGTSGNARGTPPHVHFEIHPPGSGPVNPYYLLRAAYALTPD